MGGRECECESDEQDVRACLGGQADRFRALVERHEATVMAFLVSRLGGRDAADEAAQETFVRAYFALPRLRQPAKFRSWVLGIADRTSREAGKARRRGAWAGRAGLDEVESSVVLEDVEGDQALARAVADLPEVHREVIRLRFTEGLTCASIAERLGVAVGTVTSRLTRAYALLRVALREAD